MRIWVLILALGLAAAAPLRPAIAGPWPRGAGNVFLSFGLAGEDSRADIMASGTVTPVYTRSLYAEIGAGQRLTFVLDLNGGDQSTYSVGLVRYTVTGPDAPWQAAVDLGAAQYNVDGQPGATYARLGLSLGRGLPPGGGGHWMMPVRYEGGWATLDAVGLFDVEAGDLAVWQVEGTVGLRLEMGWRAALAIKAEEWPGSDLLLSASPSVMIDLSPQNTLQVGLRVGLDGTDALGLTLNLWHEF